MSHKISQNKGPKKMGHMGMQKPHINTDNSMFLVILVLVHYLLLLTKHFKNIDFFHDNEYYFVVKTFPNYLICQKIIQLQNYSNKYMEK